jgi:phosphatidylglycerol---prolipoprotein diacylglyceryl transferase
VYPNFRYFIYDIFGIDIPILNVLQMYGFFLAMAFFAAGTWLTIELKRREKAGLLSGIPETITLKPASILDYALNFLVGFLIGFKLVYYATHAESIVGGGDFLFSATGDLWTGLLLGVVFIGFKYFETSNIKTETTLERIVMPHERVSDIVIIAAISGIVGAKILFHIEYFGQFINDPINQFFSLSGVTVYGGLIGGFLAVSYYLKLKKIPYQQMLDVCAPALFLAYGIGRLACHCSGDGCWGIDNPDPNPGFLPNWLWACDYENSVSNMVGDVKYKIIPDCNGMLALSATGKPEDGYCTALITPVFPTPLYEALACLLVFFPILVLLRKKIQHIPMLLFGIYLMLNGFERFMIEFIRVNERYSVMGMRLSMSQFIAIAIFMAGVVMVAVLLRRQKMTGNDGMTGNA